MNIKKIWCWYFGCSWPEDEKFYFGDDYSNCLRCGEEITYAHLVGDTPFSNFRANCNYYLIRKWIPHKCGCCGKRYGSHRDCIPF